MRNKPGLGIRAARAFGVIGLAAGAAWLGLAQWRDAEQVARGRGLYAQRADSDEVGRAFRREVGHAFRLMSAGVADRRLVW